MTKHAIYKRGGAQKIGCKCVAKQTHCQCPVGHHLNILNCGVRPSPCTHARSVKMPPVKRRTVLQAIPAAATVLCPALWAEKAGRADPAHDSTAVYELRIYHAAPGKLPDLLARFRDHTMKIFARHGIESVAYWTPWDEPEKSNTLIYILRHPSREAADANWKVFQDDPNWKSVKEKSEANGKLVEKVDSTFMALTDFSPQLSTQKSTR